MDVFKDFKTKLENHKAVVAEINDAVAGENPVYIASLQEDFDKTAAALSKAMAVLKPKDEPKTETKTGNTATTTAPK